MSTSLVTRNVRIGSKRTSVRLEPQLWRALETIASSRGQSINEVCARVSALKPEEGGFTSALRVFIVEDLFARAFPSDVSEFDRAAAARAATGPAPVNGAHLVQGGRAAAEAMPPARVVREAPSELRAGA